MEDDRVLLLGHRVAAEADRQLAAYNFPALGKRNTRPDGLCRLVARYLPICLLVRHAERRCAKSGSAVTTVAAVTDSTPLHGPATEKPPRPIGRRGSYLPSAQVLEELARLGPGLSTLAEELRTRLSEPADDLRR